jgi:hypothetical protein
MKRTFASQAAKAGSKKQSRAASRRYFIGGARPLSKKYEAVSGQQHSMIMMCRASIFDLPRNNPDVQHCYVFLFPFYVCQLKLNIYDVFIRKPNISLTFICCDIQLLSRR